MVVGAEKGQERETEDTGMKIMKKTETKSKLKPAAPTEIISKAVPSKKINIAAERRELMKHIRTAETIEVADDEQQEFAAALLRDIRDTMDNIEKGKRSILDPLNEARTNTFALFKPIEEEGKFAASLVETQITEYWKLKEQRRREEEARVAALQKAGKISAEKADARIAAVANPTTIKTATGNISITTKREVVIEDEKKVPKKFWVLDIKAIEKALREGEHVPGARLDDEEKGAKRS